MIARSAALARVLALALLVFAGLQLVMPFMPATSQTVPAGDGTIHLRIAVAVGFALHLVRGSRRRAGWSACCCCSRRAASAGSTGRATAPRMSPSMPAACATASRSAPRRRPMPRSRRRPPETFRTSPSGGRSICSARATRTSRTSRRAPRAFTRPREVGLPVLDRPAPARPHRRAVHAARGVARRRRQARPARLGLRRARLERLRPHRVATRRCRATSAPAALRPRPGLVGMTIASVSARL